MMISLLSPFPYVHSKAPALVWPLVIVSLLVAVMPARAQEAEDKTAEYTVETVVEGLDNPWGLAIRAGREKNGPHELFVAESGAGRVIRVSTDAPQNVAEAVTGLRVEADGVGGARLGPLGLAFLTRTKLLVSGRGAEDGQQEVQVFVLPGDDAALAAEQVDHRAKLGRQSNQPQTWWALATSSASVYVTVAGDDGEILRASHEANHLEPLRRFAEAASGKLMSPAGVTITPANRPQFLVVSDLGNLSAAEDSRLLFYAMDTGEQALALETDLRDIAGLAYSETGQLCAVDAPWGEPGRGGVYRLDDARAEGRPACRAVKIATVSRGISLAFAPDGALYVTCLGSRVNAKQGSVVKITGNF